MHSSQSVVGVMSNQCIRSVVSTAGECLKVINILTRMEVYLDIGKCNCNIKVEKIITVTFVNI